MNNGVLFDDGSGGKTALLLLKTVIVLQMSGVQFRQRYSFFVKVRLNVLSDHALILVRRSDGAFGAGAVKPFQQVRRKWRFVGVHAVQAVVFRLNPFQLLPCPPFRVLLILVDSQRNPFAVPLAVLLPEIHDCLIISALFDQ